MVAPSYSTITRRLPYGLTLSSSTPGLPALRGPLARPATPAVVADILEPCLDPLRNVGTCGNLPTSRRWLSGCAEIDHCITFCTVQLAES